MTWSDAPHWCATLAHVLRYPNSTREALNRYQDRRLRGLVGGASATVAFYRDLYARFAVDPSSFRGLVDLERLPVVSKDALRAAPVSDILAEGSEPNSLLTYRTSGSTGSPFTIRRSVAENRLLRLFRSRALYQIGVRLFDRRVVVKEPPLGPPDPLKRRRIGERIDARRWVLVSCFEPVDTIADRLEGLTPDVVLGYPGALSRIAAHLTRAPREAIRPKLVYAGGEPLAAHHRKRIETGFRARVFDLYASHEFDLIGWECPKTGLLHMCEDNVVVEVLREGRPAQEGEEGEVVLTGLHTKTMPFIRYRTGDIAKRGPSPCPCGQPFATLRSVQGRTPHYLRLNGAEVVHPYQITGRLIEKHGDWIEQHQLVQNAIGEVLLRIAAFRSPPDGALERIRALGAEVVGTRGTFSVELVATLRPAQSGKFQPYLDNIPANDRFSEANAERNP